MPGFKLWVLGSPRLERDGQWVKVDRRKALALLTYLAVTGQPHRREALTALFWPDDDHTHARAALRRILAALNQTLGGEALAADRETIGLPGPEGGAGFWLDAGHFHHLLATCRAHGHPESEVCPACLKPLAEAVALYRGDFLSGFTLRDAPDFDDWQLFQTESLRRELTGALDRLARGHSAQREFEPAIDYTRRRLAVDPFDEPAHCQLMSLYAWTGQRPAALRQYAECARLLERELGAPPQAVTTQLYEAIKAGALAPPEQLHTPVLPQKEAQARSAPLISRQPKSASPQPSLSPLQRIERGHLVGRERETAQIRLLWERAVSGEGHVLLISGEAGVGKTRLAREIAAWAEGAGATVLLGRCEAEGGPPYAPIAQMLRTAFESVSGAGHGRRPGPVEGLPDFILADLLTFAPQLRPRYPQLKPNPALDPEFERQRLFDSFVSWCQIVAGQTPLLLWVEDAHWADSGVLSLLRRLAHHAAGMRLLLVITYRDTDVALAETRVWQEVLLELNRERLAESLKLSRLSREQTGDLLVAMLATGGEITPEFLDSIYGETEGNPFYVEEVCKALIEEGKLYYAGGYWQRSEIETIVIPQSVRAAILWRVEKLPSPAQEALRLAAILGREFDFPILQAMSEWDEETLLGALEQAERAQLLGETQYAGQVQFVFAHVLIPFALRESLSGVRLQRLHRRAAMVIEAQRPDDIETLAYHFMAAGERNKAIEYIVRAAHRAETLYAYDTAAQHLQTALHLLADEAANETGLAALEKLGDVHLLNDDRSEAVLAYQEALAVLQQLKGTDKLAQVRLRRKIGEAVFDTDFFVRVKSFQVTAREGLEEGLRLMANEPPHPETVRLLVNLSLEAWRGRSPQQDWAAAERYAQQAIKIANQLGSAVELSTALNGLFIVYAGRGLYHKRLEVALQRVALSRQPGFNDRRERVRLLLSASDALMEFGRYTEALAHLQEAETIAHQIHTLSDLIEIFRRQAHCAFSLDRWDEVALDEKFLALSRRYTYEQPRPNCFHLALMACVNALRGNFERANLLRAESAAAMAAAEPQEIWGRGPRY